MTETTLSQYLTFPDVNQSSAAKALGVTAGAVWQMVRAGRDIRLTIDTEGRVVHAVEVRPIGRFAAS